MHVYTSECCIVFTVSDFTHSYAPRCCTALWHREAQQLLRGLRGLNLVGADMVEVSPPFDDTTNITSLSGATVMYEQLCLLAEQCAKA